MNSTHFNICVDFGNGVSFTVDSYVIPCPPGTECNVRNHFECEIPAPKIPAAIISTNDKKVKEERSVSTTPKWEVVTTNVAIASVNTTELSEKYLLTQDSNILDSSVTIESADPATSVPIKTMKTSEVITTSAPAIEVTNNDKDNTSVIVTTGHFSLDNDTENVKHDITSATTTNNIPRTVQPKSDTTTESFVQGEPVSETHKPTNVPLRETVPTSTDFIELSYFEDNVLLNDNTLPITDGTSKYIKNSRTEPIYTVTKIVTEKMVPVATTDLTENNPQEVTEFSPSRATEPNDLVTKSDPEVEKTNHIITQTTRDETIQNKTMETIDKVSYNVTTETIQETTTEHTDIAPQPVIKDIIQDRTTKPIDIDTKSVIKEIIQNITTPPIDLVPESITKIIQNITTESTIALQHTSLTLSDIKKNLQSTITEAIDTETQNTTNNLGVTQEFSYHTNTKPNNFMKPVNKENTKNTITKLIDPVAKSVTQTTYQETTTDPTFPQSAPNELLFDATTQTPSSIVQQNEIVQDKTTEGTTILIQDESKDIIQNNTAQINFVTESETQDKKVDSVSTVSQISSEWVDSNLITQHFSQTIGLSISTHNDASRLTTTVPEPVRTENLIDIWGDRVATDSPITNVNPFNYVTDHIDLTDKNIDKTEAVQGKITSENAASDYFDTTSYPLNFEIITNFPFGKQTTLPLHEITIEDTQQKETNAHPYTNSDTKWNTDMVTESYRSVTDHQITVSAIAQDRTETNLIPEIFNTTQPLDFDVSTTAGNKIENPPNKGTNTNEELFPESPTTNKFFYEKQNPQNTQDNFGDSFFVSTTNNQVDIVTESYKSGTYHQVTVSATAQDRTETNSAPEIFSTTQPLAFDKTTKLAKIDNQTTTPAGKNNENSLDMNYETENDGELSSENTIASTIFNDKKNPKITTISGITEHFTAPVLQVPVTGNKNKDATNKSTTMIQGNFGDSLFASPTNNQVEASTTFDKKSSEHSIITQNKWDKQENNEYKSIASPSKITASTNIEIKKLPSVEITTVTATGFHFISAQVLDPLLSSNITPREKPFSKPNPIITDNQIYIKEVIGANLTWTRLNEDTTTKITGEEIDYEFPSTGGKYESDITSVPSTSVKDNVGLLSHDTNFDDATAIEPTIKITTDSIVIVDSPHTYTVKVDKDVIEKINETGRDGNQNLFDNLSGALAKEDKKKPHAISTYTEESIIDLSDLNNNASKDIPEEPSEIRLTGIKHEHYALPEEKAYANQSPTDQERADLLLIVKTITEKEIEKENNEAASSASIIFDKFNSSNGLHYNVSDIDTGSTSAQQSVVEISITTSEPATTHEETSWLHPGLNKVDTNIITPHSVEKSVPISSALETNHFGISNQNEFIAPVTAEQIVKETTPLATSVGAIVVTGSAPWTDGKTNTTPSGYTINASVKDSNDNVFLSTQSVGTTLTRVATERTLENQNNMKSTRDTIISPQDVDLTNLITSTLRSNEVTEGLIANGGNIVTQMIDLYKVFNVQHTDTDKKGTSMQGMDERINIKAVIDDFPVFTTSMPSQINPNEESSASTSIVPNEDISSIAESLDKTAVRPVSNINILTQDKDKDIQENVDALTLQKDNGVTATTITLRPNVVTEAFASIVTQPYASNVMSEGSINSTGGNLSTAESIAITPEESNFEKVPTSEHSPVLQNKARLPTIPNNFKALPLSTESYGVVETVLSSILSPLTTTNEGILPVVPNNISTEVVSGIPDQPNTETDTKDHSGKDYLQKPSVDNLEAETAGVNPIITVHNPELLSNGKEIDELLNAATDTEVITKKHGARSTADTNSAVKPKIKIPTELKHKFNCTNLPRGRYSDEHDCRKFYICNNRPYAKVGHCLANAVFSEMKKKCVKNFSHCIRGNEFKCAADGRFVDYNRDNIYYICMKTGITFLRFKFQCQNGYTLDRTAVKCIQNVDSDNDSVSTSDRVKNNKKRQSVQFSSSSSSSSKNLGNDEGSGEKEFTCKKAGRFPHESDCRKYYICYKIKKSEFKKKVRKCGSDELFNEDKRECVDAESYECQL